MSQPVQQRRRPMTMTKETTETGNARSNAKTRQPTHVAKVRHGYGKKATYERIGVAWRNDDGSLYVKLSGTQVVSALTLYELEDRDEAAPIGEAPPANEEAGEYPPPHGILHPQQGAGSRSPGRHFMLLR